VAHIGEDQCTDSHQLRIIVSRFKGRFRKLETALPLGFAQAGAKCLVTLVGPGSVSKAGGEPGVKLNRLL